MGQCFAQQYKAYLFFIYFGFVFAVYIINNNEIYKYIYCIKKISLVLPCKASAHKPSIKTREQAENTYISHGSCCKFSNGS